MFRARFGKLGLILLLVVLASGLTLYTHTICKQPHYKDKPKYALLGFGPEVKTRVWVVQDGQTLYVDRNGDGDLTGKDERFTLQFANGNKNIYMNDCNIEIGDPDKQTRYLITAIGIYSENDKPDGDRHLMANVDIKGPVAYRQYCDAKLAANPDKAAIAHYHGPLTIGPRTINGKLTPELSRLPIGDSSDEIYAVVGTMDAEHGCWVVVRSEDLPKDLHPVVDIEYPAKKPGSAPIKQRYRLEQRC